MLDVTIERDRNLSIVTRRGYTLPDILAAIGGIAVLLGYVISTLVALWTNNYIDRFMVAELFRIKKAEDEEDDIESKGTPFAQSHPIDAGEFGLF